MFVYCVFLAGNKDQETCKSMPKSLKMDAYSEARQKVFAAAKYDLIAASTKFAAVKVFRSRGPGGQP